jgi:hypothetical protein
MFKILAVSNVVLRPQVRVNGIPVPRNQHEYTHLGAVEKYDLLTQCRQQFSVSFGKPHVLLNKRNAKVLEDSAKRVLELFRDKPVIVLGQSMAWLGEMMKLVEPEMATKMVNVPFSGKWLQSDRGGPLYKLSLPFGPKAYVEPSRKQLLAYRDVLAALEVTPDSILSNYNKTGQKTVVLDYAHSAKGIGSFLSILYDWATESGLGDIAPALHTHIFCRGHSDSLQCLRSNTNVFRTATVGFIEKDSVMDRLTMSDHLNDRVVPSYSYKQWDDPSINPLDDSYNRVNRALLSFLMIHWMNK